MSEPGMGPNLIRLAESHLHPVAEVDFQAPGEDDLLPRGFLTAFCFWGVGGDRSRDQFETAIDFHGGGLPR